MHESHGGEVKAVDILAAARRITVLTGAGISTASGIPDFRSPGGLWTRFDPSEFAYERFLADPARFWDLRARLMKEMDLASKEPNAAHTALVDLARAGRLRGLVTQNIDGLHQRAGLDEADIVEIHGSALRVRCIGCEAFFPFTVAEESLLRGVIPPPCPRCPGILKPGTVLFGETLPADALRQASAWARSCDVFLVAGSSLEVWPAAGLPRVAQDQGASLVIVNGTGTAHDDDADAVVRGRLEEVLPRLVGRAFAPGA